VVEAAIELIGATKRYGDVVALDRVDLTIRAGEFFCLLGPSGCGKTTTLNLIGGFIPLSSGELRIDGQVVNDLPPHRRSVNTVFQSYALFPHMDVADNVAFGLRMEGLPRDEIDRRVDEYLDLVGLAGMQSRSPAQLSGGQQQRVALARALAKRPSVLLLDEPLGALDLKLRRQMQVELARIHRQVGTTFVFVTHDQEEALSMATRIAVLDGGRVIQAGTPREIYRRPAGRFVADFIGESNFLEGSYGHEAGAPVLRLADGTAVPAPDAGAGVADGAAATLMVRPESVVITVDEPPDGAAGVRGRVVAVSFMGNHTRIVLATSGGTIVAERPDRGTAGEAETEGLVDREVRAWWMTRESVVFAAAVGTAVDEVEG
jgi:spermidine/putrescine transport system ATP-binding protein